MLKIKKETITASYISSLISTVRRAAVCDHDYDGTRRVLEVSMHEDVSKVVPMIIGFNIDANSASIRPTEWNVDANSASILPTEWNVEQRPCVGRYTICFNLSLYYTVSLSSVLDITGGNGGIVVSPDRGYNHKDAIEKIVSILNEALLIDKVDFIYYGSPNILVKAIQASDLLFSRNSLTLWEGGKRIMQFPSQKILID